MNGWEKKKEENDFESRIRTDNKKDRREKKKQTVLLRKIIFQFLNNKKQK